MPKFAELAVDRAIANFPDVVRDRQQSRLACEAAYWLLGFGFEGRLRPTDVAQLWDNITLRPALVWAFILTRELGYDDIRCLPLERANPFTVLLEYGQTTLDSEMSRATKLGWRRDPLPDQQELVDRTAHRMHVLTQRAYQYAQLIGYTVPEVEQRITPYIRAVKDMLLWQRDVPTAGRDARDLPRVGDEQKPAHGYLIECYERMIAAREPIKVMADLLETKLQSVVPATPLLRDENQDERDKWIYEKCTDKKCE